MPSRGPYSDLARQRLVDLRHGLLRLHKALLDSERVSYERANGRIKSRGEFFQLVVANPWFAWLHSVSELVVQIGELAEGGGAAAGNGANRVNGQARLLIKPSEEGDGFGKHYFEALQR